MGNERMIRALSPNVGRYLLSARHKQIPITAIANKAFTMGEAMGRTRQYEQMSIDRVTILHIESSDIGVVGLLIPPRSLARYLHPAKDNTVIKATMPRGSSERSNRRSQYQCQTGQNAINRAANCTKAKDGF